MDVSGRNQASPSTQNGDAVRITERGGRSHATVLYKALALALVGCSIGYLLLQYPRHSATDAGAAAREPAPPRHRSVTETFTPSHPAITAMPASRPPIAKPADEPNDDPTDLAHYVAAGQPAPTATEVIERLHEAGIYSGIGAFPPPGTKPLLVGIAAPEDFALPEGYVRHFQATDDGQRVEPILMFSPDFNFFDAAGRRIEIPSNRVVPPELAPPGLPLRLISLPARKEP